MEQFGLKCYVEDIRWSIPVSPNGENDRSTYQNLFSSTLPDIVEDRARTIMHDAVRVIIGRKNSASVTIKQKLVFVGGEEGKLLALPQSFAEQLAFDRPFLKDHKIRSTNPDLINVSGLQVPTIWSCLEVVERYENKHGNK